MLAGGDDDAEPRAVGDVDVGEYAALADHLKSRKPLQQSSSDLRALAYQHQRLDIPQSRRENIDVLNVIVPDRYVVTGQLFETLQRSDGVEIVVQHSNSHRRVCFNQGSGGDCMWP